MVFKEWSVTFVLIFARSISRVVVDHGVDNPLATCRQKKERMAPSSVPQFHWPLYLTPPRPLQLVVRDPMWQMHFVHCFSLRSGPGAEEEEPWKSTFTTRPVLLSSTSVIRGLAIILKMKPEFAHQDTVLIVFVTTSAERKTEYRKEYSSVVTFLHIASPIRRKYV